MRQAQRSIFPFVLLPVALSSPAFAAWGKESYRRGKSLSTHHHLSHAEERNPLGGSRSKPLRSESQRETGDAFDQSPAHLGIPGAHRAKNCLSAEMFLIRGVRREYFFPDRFVLINAIVFMVSAQANNSFLERT